MALTQIGAVIKLEGATQFTSQMRSILGYTKDLKQEMDVLTSSFTKNFKSVGQLNQQKELLSKQIQLANEKLSLQKNALKEVQDATSNNAIMTKEQAKQYEGLQRDVNNTTIELNKLLDKQRELSQDNSLTLFVENWKNATSKTGEALVSIGGAMTKYLTLPIVGGATAAVKVAADYQSAFTGVKKTVDEVYDANGNLIYSYEQLNEELKQIPLETASSYETVAKVAEALGQLGVEADKIPNVAKNIIMLGDSTNIMADEAAVSIAQFMNIMGEDMDKEIENFGNALVGLGNNFATDEASIMRLSTRLASAGRLVGLTTPQILGLATAMSSVGLTAEAGGTAMSTTIKMISQDVASGGENLQLFAEITGQTAEQFAETWRSNPIEALQEFLIGMANLEGGSEEVIQLLDELGFAGIRQSDTLQRLTLDYDGLTDAVALAEEEYANGNALTEEASKRYEDFKSQVNQLKEAFMQLMDQVGQDLLPMLTDMVSDLKDIVVSFKNMNPETRKFIESMLGIVAVGGPIIGVVGNLMIWFAKLKDAFSVFKGAEGVAGVTTALKGAGGLNSALETVGATASGVAKTGFGALLGPLAGILSLAGLVGTAFYTIFTKYEEETRDMANQINDAIGSVDWDTYGTYVDESLGQASYSYEQHLKSIKENTEIYTEETNQALQEGLIDMKAGVRGNLTEMKDIVDYNFKQAQISMKNSTQTARQQTKIDFDAMSNDIIISTGNARRGATEEYKQMQKNMNETGSTIKNDVKLVMTGVEDAASGVDLSSSGYHMMESLRSGIVNAGSRVISAAAGIARGIASYLKFSLPEKGPLSDFDMAMPDMIDLMVEGINDNAYKVDRAIDNLASSMVGGFDTGNNFNYGGVVINLNVPEGADGRMLVDQIEDELAARTIRRRAVFNQ